MLSDDVIVKTNFGTISSITDTYHQLLLTRNSVSPCIQPTTELNSSMKMNRLKLTVSDSNDVCWPSADNVCMDTPSNTKYSCKINTHCTVIDIMNLIYGYKATAYTSPNIYTMLLLDSVNRSKGS